MTDGLNHIATRPWMCGRCGYMMDHAAHPTARVIAEGGITLCFNCGALYVWHADAWVSMTPAEYATLDDSLRLKMRLFERVRRQVIKADLAKQGGRA